MVPKQMFGRIRFGARLGCLKWLDKVDVHCGDAAGFEAAVGQGVPQ